RELISFLVRRTVAKRAATPGLNSDRADSILGGALVVEALAETVEANGILVSGQGLREGVAIAALGDGVRAPWEVRRNSVEAMAARFATWDRLIAERRRDAAATLVEALD